MRIENVGVVKSPIFWGLLTTDVRYFENRSNRRLSFTLFLHQLR